VPGAGADAAEADPSAPVPGVRRRRGRPRRAATPTGCSGPAAKGRAGVRATTGAGRSPRGVPWAAQETGRRESCGEAGAAASRLAPADRAGYNRGPRDRTAPARGDDAELPAELEVLLALPLPPGCVRGLRPSCGPALEPEPLGRIPRSQ